MSLTALIMLICLAMSSPAKADVQACVQSKWNGVLTQGMPVQQAFDVPAIASRAIGPPYRLLSPQQRNEAHQATAYALKEALDENLGTLRQLRLEITKPPVEKKHTFHLEGVFIRQSFLGGRYDTQAWVRKGNCKIVVMTVEGSWLKNWLRDTTKLKTFMKKYNL